VGFESSFYGKTHQAPGGIFTGPDDFGFVAREMQPAVSGADDDGFFAEFYGCLVLSVEAVSGGVTA
jgi:hypothetical protein